VLVAAALGVFVVPSPGAAQQVNPDYYAGMRWRNIGPNRSGYISAVAGIQGDPTTYYIGTPEGGVWKSTSGGATWKPIFDAQHVPSIGAIAVAPSEHNTVYVGTGNQSGWSFTPGLGMYKSTDAGKTWTNVGLRGSGYINTIIVDPGNPSSVLVAALGTRAGDSTVASERGVYRTTDGGHNWTRVLPSDGASGASELNYDFRDPRVVYATLQGTGGGRGGGAVAPPAPGSTTAGIYKSADGGVTWKPIGANGLPPGTISFPLAVASGTHGQRLYGELRSGGRGGISRSGLYRSDDGGETWTLGTSQIASAGGHIYADPNNPDVVYLMGTSMYRSIDGGRHFESFMGAPSGADIRMLWIDGTNSRRMLAGADQGPTVSVDGGETWTPWYNLINGQFYRVSTDSGFPYQVCGPQQDSGTACVLSRSDFGEIRPNDWSPAGGFENGFIVADPLNPRWLYTQGWYHVLRRFDRKTSQVTVVYQPTPQDRFGGAPPLAFSPQYPHLLYMGAQYLLASSDNAASWHPISPDLTSRGDQAGATPAAGGRGGLGGGSIQALAPSPVSAGVIWVGTSNGMVQLTRDAGTSWTNITPSNLPAGGINILDASHINAGTAYLALLSRDNHPHIYRTTNFGQEWQEIVSGLPDGAAVRVVREDPVDPDLLYAGTVTSAWVSFDRGDHWQSLQLNLPNTVVSDMTVHGSDLVISTYGRGFWILDDVTPLRQVRDAMAATSTAYFFRPDSASRARWDNTQDTPLPPETTTGENPPEGAIIDYYLKAPVSGPITLTFSDAAGQIIREYSAAAPPIDTLMPNVPAYWFKPGVTLATTAGMHRIAWDLRYPDPRILPFGYTGTMLNYVEYTLNWHAIPGQTPRSTVVGPLVPPGKYLAKLKVAGQTYTRDVTVVPDPRVPATQADLVAQLRQEQRMTAGLARSHDAFSQIQKLESALAQTSAPTAGKPGADQIFAAMKALDDGVAGSQAEIGNANRDLGRYLVDMEVGDGVPSMTVVAAIDGACRNIDSAMTEIRHLAGTIAQLNVLLKQAQLPAVPAWTPPTGPACGEATP
jgi:photosystem II stability/assembly factor-like uncharacterized protein/cbb3-type cytochrome oxidase cytochrome c subunit